ncbi:MAG: alcohol dehydrogenase catalytic domain-containing protein [Candidatus Aminicenantes bacterium]|nr:alcohol dehydrogenase catalytic domain-containing protein [Candidatus Aminicenantes bacterium]
MRVSVYYSNSDIRLEKAPVPDIGPGEILMKIHASGICGSDVLEWYRLHKAPLVLGHEVAGQVIKVGEGVNRFKEGDRIVAAHHVPCNTCAYCLTGHHTACDTLRTTNFDPGGFAEFVRLPAINVDRGTFPIPDGLSYEEATFHEPLGCVLRAFRAAQLQPGQCVLVLGSGIAGMLITHLAKILGAGKILVVDKAPYRLNMARKYGADAAMIPSQETSSSIREMNSGRLADLVFVSTGAQQAHFQALECVERGGKVLFFALTDPDFNLPVSINNFFVRNDMTLTTSYGASPLDSWQALELMRAARVDVKGMISHRLPLEETGKGFQLVLDAKDSMKIIIEPHK